MMGNLSCRVASKGLRWLVNETTVVKGKRNLRAVFGERKEAEPGKEIGSKSQSGTQVADLVEPIIGAVKCDRLGPKNGIGFDVGSLEMDVDGVGPVRKEGSENSKIETSNATPVEKNSPKKRGPNARK
ncbi:hypothetical protein QYF36_008205 [Acer negundo]|nr:hypothetical protein QYF36_008205 [Acer negundo]